MENITSRNIAEYSKELDIIHGVSINTARITPDFIDGLKPVQRRALYIMYLKDKGKSFRKLASISGDTFGRVHPHSPVAIDDAIIGMAQWWNNNIPLINGSGNWGDPTGSEAGASRYIYAKLSDYCQSCFFDDWKDSVVDMTLAYDEETKEPIYLPAKYPNVLLNGTLGIGFGLSSNIPPYNFREVVEACILLMKNPDAKIILIPDIPSGADVVETDFGRICETGTGTYTQRCKYEIDAENNLITITALPTYITSNNIREKIADIKMKNGLPELVNMNDLSGLNINIQLTIRNDVNPYKFMKKLIKEVAGLEKGYPVNVTVTNDYRTYDLSIKDLILRWIDWRREQKRISISHKKTDLLSEQRTNGVKIFLMSKENLDKTINIFRSGKNRTEIEEKLISTYRNSEIRMDSLQARTLSNMRLVELSTESYDACIKRRDEIEKELKDVDEVLNTENGTDKLIIAELRDGIKKFGTNRKSNVVPHKISVSYEVEGRCILQLSSDGNIIRRMGSNIEEEPIPIDNNGFAVAVDNDSSFILVDETAHHSFIRVNEIPLDSEVPVNRYSKQTLNGNIVAMLPVDIDDDRCCTLISRKGMLKRIRISDVGPSKKACMDLSDGDRLVRGIVTRMKSNKDILIYTREGMGQRLDPNSIKITSPLAKGGNGFKLSGDDEIIGCYAINPEENQYILYVTTKGKVRLNLIEYLPMRDSKHDAMVKLLPLNERDKLMAVVGCNKLDKVQVYFDDGTSEIIDIDKLEESTMGSEPKKATSKNAVTTNIVKVKLL